MNNERKLEIAVVALKSIKEHEGRVCEEFELCKHISCVSSCNSWFIAEKALRNLSSGEELV